MMKKFVNIRTIKGNARVYDVISKGDMPKTYKVIEVVNYIIGRDSEMITDYNSRLLTILKAKDNSLRYCAYFNDDLCYGRFKFIK